MRSFSSSVGGKSGGALQLLGLNLNDLIVPEQTRVPRS
jgi:hypothetical protein